MPCRGLTRSWPEAKLYALPVRHLRMLRFLFRGRRSSLLMFLFLLAEAITVGNTHARAQTQPPPLGQANTSSAPRQLPGLWQLTPLVRVGSTEPGGRGRFEELGEGYWLDSGQFVFWARVGRNESGIYSWDGQQLRKVVAKGDTIATEGVAQQVDWVDLGAGSGDLAVIGFSTRSKLHGFVFYDGTKLSSLIEGQGLPGLPGMRLKYLPRAEDLKERSTHYWTYWASAQVVGPAVFMVIKLAQPAEERVLVRLTSGKAEKILNVQHGWLATPRP